MRRTVCFLGLAAMVWVGLGRLPQAAFPQSDPIIVGVATSLGFLEGDESLKAATLAVEEINAKGGIKVGSTMRKLQLESIDIRDAAPGVPVPEALLGMEKLILDKKVQAMVVGPFRSEALLAGMDMLAKYKVPLLGTIAMTPASEEKIKKEPDKYKYVFRTCLNAKYLVGYLVGMMKHLEKEFGFNKLFAMYQDVLWARGTAEKVAEVLKAQGWNVTGVEAYPTGASDFSAGLLKARASGAQIIMPVFDMPQSGILVKQWNSMKVPALMAGFISPMSGSDAWKTFEGKIGGALNAIFEVGNIPVPKVAASVAFYQAYQKRWGKELQSGHGPAPAYDSVYLLAEAIERAGSLDPDALVAALKQSARSGVIGKVRFDEGHQAVFGNDPNETALGCVIQWAEDGKRKVVFPQAVAEDKVRLPAWIKPAK
ncbi:MAG: ABC transporter substrate-binding protein [Thermodesulfobacteriota bacterium]